MSVKEKLSKIYNSHAYKRTVKGVLVVAETQVAVMGVTLAATAGGIALPVIFGFFVAGYFGIQAAQDFVGFHAMKKNPSASIGSV